MRLGHRVGNHLRRTGVVLKRKQRILATGAVAPEAEAIFTDQGGNACLVEQVGTGAGLLQIPEDRGGNAGHAVNANVGRGFVPAGFGVDFCPQAQRGRWRTRFRTDWRWCSS